MSPIALDSPEKVKKKHPVSPLGCEEHPPTMQRSDLYWQMGSSSDIRRKKKKQKNPTLSISTTHETAIIVVTLKVKFETGDKYLLLDVTIHPVCDSVKIVKDPFLG